MQTEKGAGERLTVDEARKALAKEVLDDFGITLDDPRLRYVEGQMSRAMLDELRALAPTCGKEA